MIAAILARYGLHLALTAGIIVSYFAWDSSRVNKGRQLEKAAVERRGEINAQKAEAARNSVERIPADRLRDRHFRD